MKLKAEDNILYWWNGEKWLVKETCATSAKADELKVRIEEQARKYTSGEKIKGK